MAVGAEDAAARGVDEQPDLRPLPLQQLPVAPHMIRIRKVQADGADGVTALFLYFQQPLLPPGDDPDLVKVQLLVHGVDKFSPDPGGSAGDHRDPHRLVLPCLRRAPLFLHCITQRSRLQTEKTRTKKPPPLLANRPLL